MVAKLNWKADGSELDTHGSPKVDSASTLCMALIKWVANGNMSKGKPWIWQKRLAAICWWNTWPPDVADVLETRDQHRPQRPVELVGCLYHLPCNDNHYSTWELPRPMMQLNANSIFCLVFQLCCFYFVLSFGELINFHQHLHVIFVFGQMFFVSMHLFRLCLLGIKFILCCSTVMLMN